MKQHILVVDDETQIRQLLGLYLERQGYRVSTAANTSETLGLLSQEKVDLVVLDIGLAGEDGLTVLASIKRAHEQVRVVMLTGMGYVEDLLQEALQHGADGYVSKVMPLEDLILTIQQILMPVNSATPACQVA